jgi:hypothetical protein
MVNSEGDIYKYANTQRLLRKAAVWCIKKGQLYSGFDWIFPGNILENFEMLTQELVQKYE